ncbi:hypothetical protein C0J52_17574 [Blattella germanica]|nr:hypothetical protein C0J52_17574 [Blattella germanica]
MYFGRQSSEFKIKLTKGELNLCCQTEQKKLIVKCLSHSLLDKERLDFKSVIEVKAMRLLLENR